MPGVTAPHGRGGKGRPGGRTDGLPAAGRQAGHPPLTNRGGDTRGKDISAGAVRVEKKLDFLSLSAAEAAWLPVLDATDHPDYPPEDSYQKGFGLAESRPCLGGRCKRAMQPHSPSAAWGSGYEHWTFGGDVLTSHLLEPLRRVEGGRASRSDWAFDLYGVDDLDLRALRRHVKRGRKISTQLTEGDHGGTLYIGSPKSERRVRIYEKASEWLLKHGYDPDKTSMSESWWRVELQLRDEPAARLWSLYVEDPEQAFQAAAGMVEDFACVSVGVQAIHLPAVPPKETEIELSLFAAFEQYGPLLDAAFKAGVDVQGLARLRASRGSRMTQWRQAKRIKAMRAIGGDVVTAGVRGLISRGDLVGTVGPGRRLASA